MEYTFKSSFAREFLKVLNATGLGKLISVQENTASDTLIVDIGPLEIPQYPVNPVKVFERVSIIAIDDYIPIVYCRKDFPLVPHLNVLPDGEKTLCLFDVSFNEIQYAFNASCFLNRIVAWFELTARGKLHQPDQPLEPYFPGVGDAIILHTNNSYPFIRLQEITKEGGKIYQEVPLTDSTKGKIYTVLAANIQKVYTQNIINKLPSTLAELDVAFDESIIDTLDQAVLDIWSIKQNPLYEKLFQQSENGLRRSAVLLIVRISLARSIGEAPEQYCTKAFQTGKNLQELYQAFGYKKDGKGKLVRQAGKPKDLNITLTPFEVLRSFDRDFAATLNKCKTDNRNEQFVQIGVGTLGSLIANNCIRSGYGQWTYVDPDIILPHNLARHCLTSEHIGQNKATAMQSYAESLLVGNENSGIKAIASNVYSEYNREQIMTAVNDACLVVDCSASVAVERHLSHSLAGNTRAVSFFMNPSGTALVMLRESADRSITLDTLEMQYYRLLTRESELSNHLKSDSRVLYSATCRGKSMAYPIENAAAFSGICTKAIKQAYASPKSCICVWDFESLSMKTYREDGDTFQKFDCKGWHITVSTSLSSKLHAIRKDKLPNETGGVLVGSYDFANKICYVVDAIDSPSDSLEYPNAYIRGKNGLLEKINRIEGVTIGNLTYIGEWHSHPANSVTPSSDDMTLLKSIAEYMFTKSSPGCMIIIGETQIGVYLESSFDDGTNN